MTQSNQPYSELLVSLGNEFGKLMSELLSYSSQRQQEVLQEFFATGGVPQLIDENIDTAIMSSKINALWSCVFITGYIAHLDGMLEFAKECLQIIESEVHEHDSDNYYQQGTLFVLGQFAKNLELERKKCETFVKTQGLVTDKE